MAENAQENTGQRTKKEGMNLWQHLKYCFFRVKNPAKKQIPEYFRKGAGDANLPFTIYEKPGTSWKDHLNKWHFLHYMVKYKMLVPMLLIFRRLVKKHLVTSIDDQKHNQFLKCFNDSFEKTIKDWHSWSCSLFWPRSRLKDVPFWTRLLRLLCLVSLFAFLFFPTCLPDCTND